MRYFYVLHDAKKFEVQIAMLVKISETCGIGQSLGNLYGKYCVLNKIKVFIKVFN